MKYLTRKEFDARFSRRVPIVEFDGLYHDLSVDCDAVISGLVGGSLAIDNSSHVLLTGMVNGSVKVSPEAVIWVEGLVNGRISIDGGAARLSGMCSAKGNRSAVVYDPREPAGGEAGD